MGGRGEKDLAPGGTAGGRATRTCVGYEWEGKVLTQCWV